MSDPVALGVAIVALVLAVVRAVVLYRRDVDTAIAGSVLAKVLQKGDRIRAIKITSSAPNAPFLVGVQGAILRSAPSPEKTSTELVRRELQGAFDERFAAATASIASTAWMTWAAALLACVSVARQRLAGTFPAPWALAACGATLLVVALSARKWRRMEVLSREEFGKLLPLLVEVTIRPEGAADATDAPGPAASGLDAAPDATTALYFEVLVGDRLVGREVVDTDVVKIGRDRKAHVRVDAPGVGRIHAVIERMVDAASSRPAAPPAAMLIDLGNEPGTMVNGVRVNKRALAHGDVIGIAEARIVIGLGRATSRPGGPFRLAPQRDATADDAPAPPAAPSEPIEDLDDATTWRAEHGVLFSFRERSPDLFFELLSTLAKDRASGERYLVAKLTREPTAPDDAPPHLVALLGEPRVIEAIDDALAREADRLYARFATPRADIEPEARTASIGGAKGAADTFTSRARYFELRAAIASGAYRPRAAVR